MNLSSDLSILSQNSLKKLQRKQKKSFTVVEKDLGLEITQIPCKNIIVCNCGLSNGLSAETLYENYSTFGALNNLLMIPGKSYCIISYKHVENARVAYETTNGILKIAQDDKPVLMGFLNVLPNLKSQPIFDKKPPGLEIIGNAVSETEEIEYISFVQTHSYNDSLKHRIVKHFGYEFLYGSNKIDIKNPLKEPLPEFTKKLWKEHINFNPDQLTINCYEPGQGIPSHVDTHSVFEDPIVSLSLGSDIIMDFRHEDGRHYSVVLPRRSLAIISGESRYDWTHGITPRKLDILPDANGLSVKRRKTRISYTFRKVKRGKCKCLYPNKCDSQLQPELNILDEEAAKLEALHVRQVYDNIAGHFSDTRHKAWPNVIAFVQSFGIGSVLIDIGCGNGKNLGHNVNNFEIGCDNSTGLTKLCRKRALEVFNCNCLSVPLRNSIADGVISIAVIHHLASETRRVQALAEVVRLLRKGGKALIYAWAKDQNREEKSSYLNQDRKNRKSDSIISETSSTHTKCIENLDVSLPVHTNRKQFAKQDLLVPWKLKGDAQNEQFLRFYHVFDDEELKNLCKRFDNIEILKYYYDQGNWCIIIKKII